MDEGEGGGEEIGSARAGSCSCDTDLIEDGGGGAAGSTTAAASCLAKPYGIRLESHCGSQLRLRGIVDDGMGDGDEEEEGSEEADDDGRYVR